MLKQIFRPTSILLLAILLLPSVVLAHKVNIFAYVEGGTVYCETYFPDGRSVVNGKVQVFDSQDRLLLTGQTDDKGLFQFAVPKIDDLTLVINASMGHKNKFLLKKSAIEE